MRLTTQKKTYLMKMMPWKLPRIKGKYRGAVDKSSINYDFHHTGWSSDESEDSQVYSPRQFLEEESKRVHKSFRHKRVDWEAIYPEVEPFQVVNIDTMNLLTLSIERVYKCVGEIRCLFFFFLTT